MEPVPTREPAPPPGLRERKKNKTRKLIQREALRLFRAHGYEAATISQIAAAAEISESTFFRYFPTKEDIIRWDEFDSPILEIFKAQPAEMSAIAALRSAIQAVLSRLSGEERAELHERIILALAVPHALGPEQINQPLRSLVEAAAAREGRRADDFGAQVFAGAVFGAGIAVLLAAADHPEADFVALLDEALARLEAGFTKP